jgi:carboxymethylenebutenolidase
VNRRLEAAAAYATGLPAAGDQVGVVGFCWGGSSSFLLATAWDGLDAAVVYYGSSPATETLSTISAPVLGLYGGDDNRVNATIPDARQEMDRLGKTFEVEIYAGAGHGFLRNQPGQEGANMRATQAAWPRTVAFFQQFLGN